MDFNNAVKERRTYYQIGRKIEVSDERICEIVENSVLHTPSAFNSQSARVIVLFSENHLKLWDIVKESLKAVMATDAFSQTEEKINSFANGYSTILYYEDEDVVKALQGQFPLYKDKFPNWSQQSNGMLQYAIWTALENEGLAASLQHYNPLIDEKVRKQWDIPESWTLIGQMPFGNPVAKPNEKTFIPVANRVKVFK